MLGLSAWTAQVAMIGGPRGETKEVKRISFADLDLWIAEGETWPITTVIACS